MMDTKKWGTIKLTPAQIPPLSQGEKQQLIKSKPMKVSGAPIVRLSEGKFSEPLESFRVSHCDSNLIYTIRLRQFLDKLKESDDTEDLEPPEPPPKRPKVNKKLPKGDYCEIRPEKLKLLMRRSMILVFAQSGIHYTTESVLDCIGDVACDFLRSFCLSLRQTVDASSNSDTKCDFIHIFDRVLREKHDMSVSKLRKFHTHVLNEPKRLLDEKDKIEQETLIVSEMLGNKMMPIPSPLSVPPSTNIWEPLVEIVTGPGTPPVIDPQPQPGTPAFIPEIHIKEEPMDPSDLPSESGIEVDIQGMAIPTSSSSNFVLIEPKTEEVVISSSQ